MAKTEELIAGLESPEDCDAAVGELIALGKKALPSLKYVVLDSTRSSETRAICAELIGQVVPDGVEWLLNALSTVGDEAGNFAAWGLRFNFAPRQIEPALFGLASSPTVHVRLNAARALQFIHVDLRSWDPVILRLARDPDARVRVAVLELLSELAEAEVLLERADPGEVTSVIELAAQNVSQEVRTLGADLGRLLDSGGL